MYDMITEGHTCLTVRRVTHVAYEVEEASHVPYDISRTHMFKSPISHTCNIWGRITPHRSYDCWRTHMFKSLIGYTCTIWGQRSLTCTIWVLKDITWRWLRAWWWHDEEQLCDDQEVSGTKCSWIAQRCSIIKLDFTYFNLQNNGKAI